MEPWPWRCINTHQSSNPLPYLWRSFVLPSGLFPKKARGSIFQSHISIDIHNRWVYWIPRFNSGPMKWKKHFGGVSYLDPLQAGVEDLLTNHPAFFWPFCFSLLIRLRNVQYSIDPVFEISRLRSCIWFLFHSSIHTSQAHVISAHASHIWWPDSPRARFFRRLWRTLGKWRCNPTPVLQSEVGSSVLQIWMVNTCHMFFICNELLPTYMWFLSSAWYDAITNCDGDVTNVSAWRKSQDGISPFESTLLWIIMSQLQMPVACGEA